MTETQDYGVQVGLTVAAASAEDARIQGRRIVREALVGYRAALDTGTLVFPPPDDYEPSRDEIHAYLRDVGGINTQTNRNLVTQVLRSEHRVAELLAAWPTFGPMGPRMHTGECATPDAEISKGATLGNRPSVDFTGGTKFTHGEENTGAFVPYTREEEEQAERETADRMRRDAARPYALAALRGAWGFGEDPTGGGHPYVQIITYLDPEDAALTRTYSYAAMLDHAVENIVSALVTETFPDGDEDPFTTLYRSHRGTDQLWVMTVGREIMLQVRGGLVHERIRAFHVDARCRDAHAQVVDAPIVEDDEF